MREDSQYGRRVAFNPAATIYDGKIVVMYRAEDDSARGWFPDFSDSATSTDGIHFEGYEACFYRLKIVKQKRM